MWALISLQKRKNTPVRRRYKCNDFITPPNSSVYTDAIKLCESS